MVAESEGEDFNWELGATHLKGLALRPKLLRQPSLMALDSEVGPQFGEKVNGQLASNVPASEGSVSIVALSNEREVPAERRQKPLQ